MNKIAAVLSQDKNNFKLEFLRFLLVGVINTIIGMSLMYGFYNILKLGYWGSTALAYLIAGFIAFFLNKSFTFRYKGNVYKALARYLLVVGICYVISYLAARPLVSYLFLQIKLTTDTVLIENVSMLVGMGFYTVLNFTGHKLFTYREK